MQHLYLRLAKHGRVASHVASSSVGDAYPLTKGEAIFVLLIFAVLQGQMRNMQLTIDLHYVLSNRDKGVLVRPMNCSAF